MASVILLVLVFAFGVAVVMGLYLGATKLPAMLQQKRLDARLLEVSQPVTDEPEENSGKLLVKVRHEGPLPALDRMMAGSARGSALGAWIEQSGTRTSVSGVFLIAVASAVLVGIVAVLATRAPLAMALGGTVGFALPFLFLKV